MERPSEPPTEFRDLQADLAADDSNPPPEPEQTLGLGGLLTVALGSLLAVPGVFFNAMTGGAEFLGPVVLGPLVEETLKPTGLVILLTRRPGFRLSAGVGVLAGAFSGLVFAALENAIYLLVYVPHPRPELVVWRWTVCVGVHVTCSALVGFGLARSTNRRTRNDDDNDECPLLQSASPHLLEEPRERSGVFQGASLTCLVAAVVLHGGYNLAAMLLQGVLPLGQ